VVVTCADWWVWSRYCVNRLW